MRVESRYKMYIIIQMLIKQPHEQLRDVILIFFYDNRNDDGEDDFSSATLSQLGSETNRFSGHARVRTRTTLGT